MQHRADRELAVMPIRSEGAMLALAILFPIHRFFIGKVGSAVAFLLTAGGLGVWWFVDLFLVMGMTRDYNRSILDARERQNQQ